MNWNITKNYEDQPSKNIIDETQPNKRLARVSLSHTAYCWKKYGGAIIKETKDTLIVEDGNGEGRITFKIERAA